MHNPHNHHTEDLDEDVKVIKQVKALSNDLLKPRYHATYIITSEEPKTVRARYTCGDEVGEGKHAKQGNEVRG